MRIRVYSVLMDGTDQDWTNGNETVVQPSGVCNVAGLERELKATAAHAEAHGI